MPQPHRGTVRFSCGSTLPARVRAVTFPDAEHGYLIGQHAMVFRYRIVPIDYSIPGMIGAMAP